MGFPEFPVEFPLNQFWDLGFGSQQTLNQVYCKFEMFNEWWIANNTKQDLTWFQIIEVICFKQQTYSIGNKPQMGTELGIVFFSELVLLRMNKSVPRKNTFLVPSPVPLTILKMHPLWCQQRKIRKIMTNFSCSSRHIYWLRSKWLSDKTHNPTWYFDVNHEFGGHNYFLGTWFQQNLIS